jgi:hypothetical protein
MEMVRTPRTVLFTAFSALALATLNVALLRGAPEAAAAPLGTKAAKLKLVNDSTLQMSNASPLPNEGEGVYQHSYERLGAQSGFHTTPVLYDPFPEGAREGGSGEIILPGGIIFIRPPTLTGNPRTGSTRPYSVLLQVLCAKKFGKVSDPHDIALNVPSGRTVTLNAFCPKKTVLIGGGFQRMAYEGAGGVYPQESHAVSKKEWQATGTAFGTIKNDAVSIGYCMGSPKRKPLLREVSSSVAIAPGQVGFTTTPTCTGGRKLISNGFDLNPKAGGPAQSAMLFADGIINADKSFTASAYNGTQAMGTLTAYGYCMKNKVIGGSIKKFAKKFGDKKSVVKDDQDGNPNG